jgi:hypothetical protein
MPGQAHSITTDSPRSVTKSSNSCAIYSSRRAATKYATNHSPPVFRSV